MKSARGAGERRRNLPQPGPWAQQLAVRVVGSTDTAYTIPTNTEALQRCRCSYMELGRGLRLCCAPAQGFGVLLCPSCPLQG